MCAWSWNPQVVAISHKGALLSVSARITRRTRTSRIESPTEIMTVVSGCPMERSQAEAFARLILWMESDYGWNRWRAYDLLTHVARISVGYYALGTVAVKIAKEYLPGR